MLALLLAANLGVSHFTATGPKVCQRKTLEGVLYLHSFVYEDARDAFVEAQAAAPCPIAYWGEAMTYDHSLWDEQDAPPAKAALAKIPADAKLSPAEKGLVEAARALYEKDHAAWMERLAQLHEQLPKDDEVALFYALSLYANSRHGADVKRSMQAASIAMDVFQRNPSHPGAAHYLIHACDSPDHAILALKAARRYAQIAPAAGHALHMPSHIFVQLGMWPEVESSNLAAVKAGMEFVERHDLAPEHADWHSYAWLAAARIELGRADEVLPMIARVRQMFENDKSSHVREVHAMLVSAWLSATQQWARADELLLPDQHGTALRVRLNAAAATGDEAAAEKLGDELVRLGEPSPELAKLIVAAKRAQAHSVRDTGSIGDAIEATRALADAGEREPAYGPAFWTPPREELGDLFVRSHRFAEAEAAFRAALERRPNRLHALRGLEESARSAGDLRAAAEAQSRLPK